MQTLISYLLKAEDFFRKKNFEKPRLEAQALFAGLLGLSRIELFTNDQKPLQENEVNLLRDGIKRRVAGEPLAYILGKKEFFTHEFQVSSDVLIPRPETEQLVELVLKSFIKKNHKMRLIDMACGSGAIGISIGLELIKLEQEFDIFLGDISNLALEICRKNLDALCLGIKDKFSILKSDKFSAFFKEDSNYLESVDLIISNPPYILEGEEIDFSVKNYEPHVALFVYDPKEFYQSFFSEAFALLRRGGGLWLESSKSLIELQIKWLKEVGFINIKSLPDYSGMLRFIYAEKTI